MNFLDYKTPEELLEKTGLTVSQAIKLIEQELTQLKEGNKEKT